MTFAIAAAGTGGHVFPALAVAEALLDLGVARDEIRFVGGDRLEARAVPDAGFAFTGYPLVRLERSRILANLRIPFVLRSTSARMRRDLEAASTRVVLGMGGYVTVPASMAAKRAGIRFFLQEQNARPGLASRFAARRAAETFLGLPGRAEQLPRSRVVGNPIRPALAGLDRDGARSAARRRYGLDPGGVVLGILGGSLGAAVLNEAAPRLVAESGADGVVHLTGPEAHPGLEPVAAASAVPWACRPFEPEMEFFYAAVDLVVCRAGAMTVSELAVTGTPAVLVPLERVGQEANAAAAERWGSARVTPQGELDALPGSVAGLLADPAELDRMGRAATAAGRPDAARAIAARLVEAAGA